MLINAFYLNLLKQLIVNILVGLIFSVFPFGSIAAGTSSSDLFEAGPSNYNRGEKVVINKVRDLKTAFEAVADPESSLVKNTPKKASSWRDVIYKREVMTRVKADTVPDLKQTFQDTLTSSLQDESFVTPENKKPPFYSWSGKARPTDSASVDSNSPPLGFYRRRAIDPKTGQPFVFSLPSVSRELKNPFLDQSPAVVFDKKNNRWVENEKSDPLTGGDQNSVKRGPNVETREREQNKLRWGLPSSMLIAREKYKAATFKRIMRATMNQDSEAQSNPWLINTPPISRLTGQESKETGRKLKWFRFQNKEETSNWAQLTNWSFGEGSRSQTPDSTEVTSKNTFVPSLSEQRHKPWPWSAPK
uniref:Uncharacterized protein n=1 Tax=Scherffelia dubia TaxID=3190 RepID=A0A142BYD6_SCHDU|nr:hypothetical protein [Scherffelia dubia]YP_009241560.1 hypothetical protein [Scherffelia dubia]AMP43428.1 hypothetical protein [Scherffelia dubia]AMP43467.1 hypothetical protein [Scherffelia dubia]